MDENNSDDRRTSVLFVCLGNICRSPYAHLRLEDRDCAELEVLSAGFLQPDRSPPFEAVDAARRRGLESSGHRSRVIAGEDVDESTAVFVFDRFNQRDVFRLPGLDPTKVFWLGDFDPEWAGKRAIIDPWGRGEAFFAATFDRIDRCVAEVAAVLCVTPRGS